MHHISVGGLIRKRADQNDELATQIKNITKQGQLIDTKLTIDLIKDELTVIDQRNGFILDGFPRNVDQGKAYFDLIADLKIEQLIVINIELTEAEAVDRLTSRYTCPSCDESYSSKDPAMMPKVSGICDKCGAALVQRIDDNLESLRKRYDLYNHETKPLLNYYQDLGVILIKVNGNQPKDAILKDILNRLLEVI